jgi:amyloid beta precursor protein binding protein 1
LTWSSYRNRALRDASLVHENVKAILTKIGRHPESIGFDEVSLFCKNSNFIRRINFRSIASEYATTPDAHHAKTVLKALSDWDSPDSLVHDYIAIRAWQKYYSNTGKLPGVNDAEMNSDLDKIKNEALEYLKSLGYNEPLGERTAGMLQEVVRSGGGELHVTAAMAGGIVAQEIIKVSSNQSTF